MARPATARMTYAEYLAAEAGWELLEARPGETIELACLGVHLDVAAVYA